MQILNMNIHQYPKLENNVIKEINISRISCKFLGVVLFSSLLK